MFTSGPGGITFYPGFTASSGCAFTALIDNSCNEVAYNTRTAQNEIATQENEEGVRVNNHQDVWLFPNPADDKLSISFEVSGSDSPLKCNVTDISGRVYELQPVHFRSSGNMVQFDLDVSWLAPGIYMFVAEKQAERRSAKFIITR